MALHVLALCVYLCVYELNETRHNNRIQEEEIKLKLLFPKSDLLVFPRTSACSACLYLPFTKNSPHTSIDLCSVEIRSVLYCAVTVQQELRTVQDIGLAFKLKVSA